MAEIGHNHQPSATVNELKSFIQRIQNLEEEKAEIAESIKEVKAEAKARGYDVKALNIALSLLKKDEQTLESLQIYADFLEIFG